MKEKILIYIVLTVAVVSLIINGVLLYQLNKSETFPPENYNPWIHDDPSMMCVLLNNLDNANLREPACNAQSAVCEWSGNRCVAK